MKLPEPLRCQTRDRGVCLALMEHELWNARLDSWTLNVALAWRVTE
jgi:hypothetical protein